MKTKILSAILLALFILPNLAFADAPPPSPIRTTVLFDNQKITDERFYAALLTCEKNDNWDGFKQVYRSYDSEDKIEYNALTKLNSISESDPTNNCTFTPNYLPFSKFCSKSECIFNWVLGNFKVAVYIPSLDKVFISNSINRKYEGHYGRDTTQVYEVDLTKDGGSTMKEISGKSYDDTIVTPSEETEDTSTLFQKSLSGAMMGSLLVTLLIELIVALIFAWVKKFPKRILLGIFIGNLISVPLLWLIATKFYWTLIPAEILVVVFETWIIKLFGKEKINWKWCLIIGFVMNLLSFIFGPMFYIYQ